MELRGLPRGPEIAGDDVGRPLNAVLDGGINLIDTSPDYGRSEELIGTHIGQRRDEFFLSSKCGCPLEMPIDVPPPPHDFSAGNDVFQIPYSAVQRDHEALITGLPTRARAR